MTTLSIQRTVSGVLASADSATILVTNSSGATVVATTVVAPASEGVYSFDTPYLIPGQYTATWTFSVTGQPDDVSVHTFTADGPTSVDRGISLKSLEQRLAARLGPYKKKSTSAGSSTGLLVCSALRTSLDLGGIDELYILRRGRTSSGAIIPNFNSDDRQRVVAEFDPATGSLTPDRAWAVAPAVGEEFELHALDPEEQLRPAIQWGLERCFFWDRGSISITGGLRTIDLTASLPWITDPAMVYGVESAFPNNIIPPKQESWWRPIQVGNSVYLHTNWIGAVDLSVTALRSHSTYVNGEMSFTGPNDDDDILAVDPRYALMAAHVECWTNFTSRLTVLAALGLGLTAKQVSDVFTLMSANVARQQAEHIKLRWDSPADLGQIGNIGADPS